MRILFLLLTLGVLSCLAQENYEIQVYASPTMGANRTMYELHSNFTVQGTKVGEGGERATTHALHETIEITHGWNDWFETGFYVFMAKNRGFGYEWVGNHIRPRVRVPTKWNWPVGVSLSTEAGYQRKVYSADTWTWEIRPIVDKQLGKLYVGFNPSMSRSWHGPGVRDGLVFSPNFKAGYNVTGKVTAGFEYYGSVGPFQRWAPLREQGQQFVPSIDLNLGPDWEFNFGVGVGVTQATDHLIIKMIVGRRFDGWGPWSKKR